MGEPHESKIDLHENRFKTLDKSVEIRYNNYCIISIKNFDGEEYGIFCSKERIRLV